MASSVQALQDAVTFEWPRNPYPGLRPFREDEALIFYGRNSHKDEVLARLNSSQLVFVTGPSGCGKSSLIKAGVLPALQAGLLTKAGYHWTTLQMRPGQRPLVNLAAAFKSVERETSADGGNGFELDSVLESEASGLWLAANSIVPLRNASPPHKAPARLLLLIDQFEEIFGEQIQEPADVDRFVRLLVRFAERPHPNLFIIVTLRSDYLGQCANFEGLAESINRTQFLTPVLTRAELSQAIARPAEDYNGEVEPELVEQIIRDMRTGTAYHSDSLPLMQHALLWMWSKAWQSTGAAAPPRPPFDGNDPPTKLTLQAYQDNGGIEGILDRHAEDVLREAVGESKDRRRIAESLFRRLSERDAEGRYRRSPTSAEKLCSIVGCEPDELQQVIRPFEHPDVCFLEQRQSESANEVLVDVSHESLIRQWNTAKAWADAEAEKVRKFRELAHATQTWERRKRSPDFLKRRGELEVINAWWEEEAPNENWTRRYTLTPEGGKLTDAFHDVKEYLRVSSETDRAEQQAAERDRIKQASERSRRQRNRYFAIAVFLLFVSTAVAGLLWWQTKQYDAYRVRVAAALAEEALKVFGPARALLAAMEGIDDVLPQLPQIQRVGYRALAQLRERRILDDPAAAQVQGVQFAPHQPVLITTTQNGWLRFWKLKTGELIDSYLVGGRFLTARWSPDGTQLFVSARDIDAFFLIPCSHEKLRPFFSECASSTEDKKRSFNQEVGTGSFSPDGRWIVTGAFYATTKLWDVTSTEKPEKDFGHGGSWMVGAAFSHDSQRLAVAGTTGEIRIFRIADALKQADENPEAKLKPKSSADQMSGMEASESRALVNSLAFHPTDTNILLATYQDGTARLWDIAGSKDKLMFERMTVFQGVFNHDGEWAATAHDDRVVRLWPLRAAQPAPQILRGHGAAVFSVAYSPDGATIASGSSDRTARIWSQQPALGSIRVSAIGPSSGSPAGKVSVRKHADQLIVSYNGSDFAVRTPPGFGDPAAAAISPSGKDAVIAPKQGRPYLFNLRSKGNIVALPGRPSDWRQIGFFQDPEPPPDGAAERIIGITQAGEAYSWPYFGDLRALKAFAASQLPFIGEARLQLRDDLACRIKANPDKECQFAQDASAQD